MEFVFGGEFVFGVIRLQGEIRLREFVFGIRLRRGLRPRGEIVCGEFVFGIRLRVFGGPLKGISLRNSSSSSDGKVLCPQRPQCHISTYLRILEYFGDGEKLNEPTRFVSFDTHRRQSRIHIETHFQTLSLAFGLQSLWKASFDHRIHRPIPPSNLNSLSEGISFSPGRFFFLSGPLRSQHPAALCARVQVSQA